MPVSLDEIEELDAESVFDEEYQEGSWPDLHRQPVKDVKGRENEFQSISESSSG